MAKKGGKLGPVVEKKIMPVETDVNKLVNFVCGGNIYIKGEEIKVSCNRSSSSSGCDNQSFNSFRSSLTASIPTGFGLYTPDHQKPSKNLIPKPSNTGESSGKSVSVATTNSRRSKSSEDVLASKREDSVNSRICSFFPLHHLLLYQKSIVFGSINKLCN